MLDYAPKASEFFCRDTSSPYHLWRLKTPEEHASETGIKPKEPKRYIFSGLDDVGPFRMPTDLQDEQLTAEIVDRIAFIDLLKRLLSMDQVRTHYHQNATCRKYFFS